MGKRTFTKYPSNYVKASEDPESVIEYRDWAIHYNRDGNGKYSVWDFDGYESYVEDFDTLEDAQSYVDSLVDYYAAVAEYEAEERRDYQQWLKECEESENNT